MSTPDDDKQITYTSATKVTADEHDPRGQMLVFRNDEGDIGMITVDDLLHNMPPDQLRNLMRDSGAVTGTPREQAMTNQELPPDVLKAWALTKEEAEGFGTPGNPACRMVISREGAHNPEPGIHHFDGDTGPDRWTFDKNAADKLLAENGYRRIDEWTPDPAGGWSCEVEAD
jgi:hypothetical protein